MPSQLLNICKNTRANVLPIIPVLKWLRWRANKITEYMKLVVQAVKDRKLNCFVSVWLLGPQRVSLTIYFFSRLRTAGVS